MQTRIRAENPEKVKSILRTYKEQDIEYNEVNDHFNHKLKREGVNKQDVIRNLLNPENLIFVGVSKSKNPRFEYVHDLYFKIGKNRIIKIPTSMKAKSLYLITIIGMRRIDDEARKYE